MGTVGHGELSHVVLSGPDHVPQKWIALLHGILGTKQNLRPIGKAITQRDYAWGALLIDLRMHGESQDFDPPHTIAACAEDLARHFKRIEIARLDALLGHSFGGKVALAYADLVHGDIDHLFLLDSNPGPRPTARGSETTIAVLNLLAALPADFERREDFLNAVIAAGQTRAIAQWLGMNLVRSENDRFRLGLDLGAIQALLDDYFARDFWHVVESPQGSMKIHVVIGAASDVYDAADRERMLRAATAHPNRVFVHLIEAAGHWVHVDAPDAILSIVTTALGV